jgi:hypothetical protein
MDVRPRKFGLDMDVRWNSTYLMLKHVIPYKTTFSVFIQTHYQQVMGQTLLTQAHWEIGEKILTFLELFYDSTVALSGIYYPTSPLMLHHIIEIASHLSNYENDILLTDIVVPMKSKFLKYWKNIPILYSFAFVLDPRAKLRGFNSALQFLSNVTFTDYSDYYNNVCTELSNVFPKYDSKFGGTRLQRATQSVSTSKVKFAWGKIYGTSSSNTGTTTTSVGHTSSPSNFCPVSELSMYVDSDPITVFDDDFGILSWWREHKNTYPILSILAKDVLTVPVSTISSESVFSLTSRVLEERRRCLTSEMVETLTCLKDWQMDDDREQHNLENPELQQAFENQYLDGDGDDNQDAQPVAVA